MFEHMEKIIRDKNARIPFVFLGIFLIIGSIVNSIILINVERKEAESIHGVASSLHIQKMISALENDLSTCLNYAGMDAMRYVGRYPVTKPNMKSETACRYMEGEKWDFEEMKKFNINWIRDITRRKMNLYIEENYRGDVYNDGRYAINVDYIKSWKDIEFEEIYMEIEVNDSLKGVREIFGIDEEKIPVYLIFHTHLKMEIKDMKKNMIVGIRNANISSLITSRFPLMMHLANKFEECINSSKPEKNKLFLLTTLISEIYSEGRALAQYGGMYEDVPNIVDNRWLRYIINGAILFEEFMIFNSIDALSAIHLLINSKDIMASGYPVEEEAEELMEGNANISQVFIDMENEMLQTLPEGGMEKICDIEPKIEINISQIAENLLYEKNLSFYYYNDTFNLTSIANKFKGYLMEKNGIIYHLIPSPPYKYFNRTYYILTGKNISRNFYKRNFTYRGYNFYLIEGNGIYDGEIRGMNKEIVKRINDEINSTYTCIFHVNVRWNSTPFPAEKLISIKNVTEYVKKGDAIKSFPYTEQWEVEWKANGSIKKIGYEFEISAEYPDDIVNPFDEILINLTRQRYDANLFNISRDFVSHFVSYRNEMMGKDRMKDGFEEYTIKIPSGERFYGMKWIYEEVEENMKAILEKIRGINASIGEDFRTKNLSDNLHDLMNELLEKYREEKHMLPISYMKDDKYQSCGARVIERVERWYVDEIEKELINATKIMEKNVREIEKNYGRKMKLEKELHLPPLQFGLSMELKDGEWKEKVAFSVNQEPDYFTPSAMEDEYKFMAKNICIFGPSGLPILPTAVTPWVMTINAWYIEIQGQFKKFEISDTSSEMIPNPIFGGIAQTFSLERNHCQDPFTGEIIGETIPPSFVIRTGCIAFVPPGFVGDINPESYTIEAKGEGIPVTGG